MTQSQTLFLSVSQRSSFKKCRWAWQWRYLRGVEPKVSAPPLRFGSLIHKALEIYYPPGVKRGPHPAKTFRKVYDAELKEQMGFGFRDEDGKWEDARELGVLMLNGYVEQYGGDHEWEVIASEQEFEAQILNRHGAQIATAVGVVDGIWKHRVTREYAIVDHKAVAQIVTKHLNMDEQSGQYWTYGFSALVLNGIISDDIVLSHILFNFLRKQRPDERPKDPVTGQCLNQDGTISKQQPAPLFLRQKSYRDGADMEMMRHRTAQEAREILLVHKKKLSLLKSPSQFNCATCGVREICELHEVGQDWKAMAKSTLKPKAKSPAQLKREAVEYEHAH